MLHNINTLISDLDRRLHNIESLPPPRVQQPVPLPVRNNRPPPVTPRRTAPVSFLDSIPIISHQVFAEVEELLRNSDSVSFLTFFTLHSISVQFTSINFGFSSISHLFNFKPIIYVLVLQGNEAGDPQHWTRAEIRF